MGYKQFIEKAKLLGYRKTTIEDHGTYLITDSPGKVAFCFTKDFLNYCLTYEDAKAMGWDRAIEMLEVKKKQLEQEVE